MKKTVLILSTFSFFFFNSPASAIDVLIQTSPANGSTVTTTTMSWEIPLYSLYSGDHYRVQVDDDQAFASINKDYNPNNSSYTPTGLSEGTWYWKVKAKDSGGVWSDWSSIWSFILVFPSPTPIPTNTPIPTPTDIPNPTHTPTPSKTPTPTKTPTSTPIPTITPLPTLTIAATQYPQKTTSDKSTLGISSEIKIPDSIKQSAVLGTNSGQNLPLSASHSAQTLNSLSPFPNILKFSGIAVLALGIILGASFIVQKRNLKV